MTSITVLYDASCHLCVACAEWIARQEAYLPIELMPAGSRQARHRYGEVPWLGEELVVVADDGSVWAGAAAFLTCLWALVDWREASYWLSSDTLSGVAGRFFLGLSKNRRAIARWAMHPKCEDGACRAPYR